MSSGKKRTGFQFLARIPAVFIEILFRISLILVFLNSGSLVLAAYYKTETTVAVLSLILSVLVALSSRMVWRQKKKLGLID